MYFRNGKDVEPMRLRDVQIGGVYIQGEAELRVMMASQHMQLVELRLQKGFHHPLHKHDENESVGYVISGCLEMGVDGEIRILKPGDVWHHGKGIFHYTKALEDTLAVEIHSPKRTDYGA